MTEASDEQIAYAREENTVLSQQVAINNHIFSSAREITGKDIQTFNQLTEHLLSDPEHDKAITALIEKSGYLELWRLDMQKNPGSNDVEIAIKEIDQEDWLTASGQLEDTALTNLERYKTNLFFYRQQYQTKQLTYLEMHIRLYEKLVEFAKKMLDVARKLETAAQ
ncbi:MULTISPECIES: hypothetical protein [unclassified Chryseobacterium]|uniref:hypothetical protein n=1 Tax=unclassified Chryseobacterium TaxID=2593645 RepID=UPI0011582FE5|nr:hypothetical protein [Chryseobacterium sp. ON_d1]GEJ45966.1 hypothetical protein CRS_25740 [Chryseobacterium sp. ON_d1]